MKLSKKKRYLLNFIFLAAAVIIVLSLLGRALVPVTYAYYYKHDLQVMKENNKTYDLIFIGASRTYRSFDPSVFKEETEYENVLNAGSVAQTIEGSYYLAKELIAQNHPETIVLGLSYNELFYDQEDKSPRGNMVLYDRLSDPLIKAEFALDVLHGDDLLYLSNVYRYGSSISLGYLKKVRNEKQNLIDTDFAPVVKKKEYYAGDGFVYSKRKVKKGNMPMRGADEFDESKIDPDKEKYLDRIVSLCRDNGITLELVTGPTSLMYMYNIKNYQGATDYYKKYAAGHGLHYYNLSMLKDRFKLFKEKYMLDYNHVNGRGAERASKVYAQILKNDEAGVSSDDLFYNDISEIMDQVDYVVAVKAETGIITSKVTGRKYIEVKGLSNKDDEIEFQIRVKNPKDKKYKVVYDYSTASMYDVTDIIKAGGKVAVYARIKGHDVKKEAYQIYTVNENVKRLVRKLL